MSQSIHHWLSQVPNTPQDVDAGKNIITNSPTPDVYSNYYLDDLSSASHDDDDCSVYSDAVINCGFRCVLDSNIQPYEGCRSYNVNPTSLLYC